MFLEVASVSVLVPVGVPSFPGLRILLPGDASRSCWTSSSLVRSASSVPFKAHPGHAGRGPRDEDPQTGADGPLRVRRQRLRQGVSGRRGAYVAGHSLKGSVTGPIDVFGIWVRAVD